MTALTFRESQHSGFYDSIADAVFLIDAETGHLIDANPAALQSLGYSRRELLKKSITDIDKMGLLEFKRLMLRLKRNHTNLVFTSRYLRKDKSSFPVEVKISHISESQQHVMLAVVRDLSERQCATSALKTSLQYSNEAILVIDTDGGIAGYNQHFQSLWNIPENIIATHDDDQLIAFIVEQLLEPLSFLQGMKNTYENPDAYSSEMLYCRDGRVLECYAQPQAQDDEIAGRIWSFRDVTERSHKVMALQESEATYRNVISSSKDGFCLTDLQGRILEVNQSYLDLSGYSREEMLELSMFDLQFATDSVDLEKHLSIVREFGGSIFTTRHRSKQGQPLDVEVCISCWDGIGGRMFAFIRDIRQRKHAEEVMALTQSVFEATSEGIMVTDQDGVILLVNKALESSSGFEARELVGQKPDVLASGEHDDDFFVQMWHELDLKDSWSGEIKNRRKDGELYSELLTINTIRNKQQQVTNYVATFADISELQQSHEENDFLSQHDPLTRLPNRLLLQDRIDHAINRAQRDQKQLAVFYLDLDRFKNVNDSLGHAVGDELLKTLSCELASRLRCSDTLARIGGDEFVVLLEDQVSLRVATSVANKIMDVFAGQISLDQHQLYITASIGISFFPHDGHDTASLLQHADMAMYQAKNKGRNNFEFFDSTMTRGSLEKMVLENALQGAIVREELFLVYQPLVRLDSGEIEAVEALVRWQHPDMGVIFPDQFIGLAEETGMVHSIGEYVLRAACRQMVSWQAQGFAIKRISVNLSAVQLERASLANDIARILEETGLPPVCLELEITESMIAMDSGRSVSALQQLSRLGVSIAVDDFGTGYSSLGYLKDLPLNHLKIDKSFVRDIVSDSNSLALIRAMIAIADSLGYSIIAEGIETRAQLELLLENGCVLGQGYNYHRPETGERMLELLSSDLSPPFQPHA